MLKPNYDDLSSIKEGNQKSKKKLSTPVVAVICLLTLIIIAVAILVIYNILSKTEAPATTKPDVSNEKVIEEVNKPEAVSTVQTPEQVESPVLPVVVPDFTQTNKAQSLGNVTASSFDDEVKYTDYVMTSTDTLDSVATKFNVTLQTILSINQIKNPAAVVEGTTLRIPDRSGRLYTVEEGDMLSSITKKFNLTMGWKTLQDINGLKAEKIFVGQTLFIPDETAVKSISFAASGIAFKSPVSGGTTVAYYGQSKMDPTTKKNLVLAGVLISAPEGTTVKAASSGTVMDVAFDAGSQSGFFVKISHDGGYSSYYYYLDSDSIEVSVSDKVDIGDSIGTISSSSSPYGSPTLYFQIEQNGIMLDPSVFFGN